LHTSSPTIPSFNLPYILQICIAFFPANAPPYITAESSYHAKKHARSLKPTVTTMSLKNGTLHPFQPQNQHPHAPLLIHADAFPSSTAFDAISSSLSSSDASRKDAIKQGNAIFAFTLKNSAGDQESWYIDLKESGTVGKGVAPEGKKAAVTLVLSDSDFGKLVSGKANAQKLFMSGKLKVRGDVMKVKWPTLLSICG
jgi:putative sterol carrier protein